MPEGTLITEAMKKALGVESAPVLYDVEKGHIRRFAEAIGDPNLLFSNEAEARETPKGGIVAPPTYVRSCWPGDPPFDVSKASGLERLLDGGSEWEFFHQVRPGDRIAVTVKIADFKEREGRMGKMLITTTVATYRNQFNQVVATERQSLIRY